MNKKIKYISSWILAGITLSFASCSMRSKVVDSQPAEEVEFREPSSIVDGKMTPNFFIPTPADMAKAPSTTLDLEDGELIFDNTRAYLAKLNLIRNAKTSIDMVYYIWSTDLTSTLISEEIVKAAERGVRVRILLDAFSSYKDMDYFRYLQARNKNIQIKFYNLPSKGFLEQAYYLTLGCPKEIIEQSKCADFKRTKWVQFMNRIGNDARSFTKFMAALDAKQRTDMGFYLSGVYAKNPMAMMMPMQDHIGAVLKAGSAKPMTAEDKEGLKKIAKLYWDSRTGEPLERVEAYVQLYLGTLMMPEVFKGIDEKAGSILPVDFAVGGSGSSGSGDTYISESAKVSLEEPGEAWSFLTDYTHHKLLLVDSQKFVLGGRNIEDSYHTRGVTPEFEGVQKNKYEFWDTDFAGELKAPSKAFSDSYTRLFNFSPMSLDIETFYKLIPNDFVANSSHASRLCKEQFPERNDAHKAERKKCMLKEDVKAHFNDTFEARVARIEEGQRANLEIARRKFFESKTDSGVKYVAKNTPGEPVSSSEWFQVIAKEDLVGTAKVQYLENLNWNRYNPTARSFGTNPNTDVANNKNIQAVWKGLLKQVCDQKGGNKEVIINNAYFFPSADLLSTLSNMIDGSWDCRGVQISILTNSFETTDLNVVNLFARHALLALVQHSKKNYSGNGAGATLRAYELTETSGKSQMSLHSKVAMIGDNVIVGSANWDVRSHLMDTNNAIWFQNAPRVAAKYRNWFYKQMRTSGNSHGGKIVDVTKNWGAYTPQQLQAQDMKLMDQMAARWNAQAMINKKDPKRFDNLKKRISGMLTKAFRDSYSFLSRKNENPVKIEAQPLDKETGSVGIGIDLLRMRENSTTRKIEDMQKFNDFYKPI